MVTDSYAYDAWGNATGHNDTTSQPYQFVGQLGYYTHYQIPSFGLLELGVRFYNPEVGRFTQRDPAKLGTICDYAYALDNPMWHTDASGLTTRSWDWIKKAYKCGRKAIESCRSKNGRGYERCYWSEFAKCMGKDWTRTACKDYFCWLWPNSALCNKGYNPCDYEDKVTQACQDCCEIKYYCCLAFNAFNPGGPIKCKLESDVCHTKCEGCLPRH